MMCPDAMWGVIILPHLIACPLGSEIRNRLSLLLLGNSPNSPMNVNALSTKLLSIFSIMASLVQKLLKVERPGLDSEFGSIAQ